MTAPRISSDELNRIVAKRGYGIASSIGKGITAQIRDQREVPDLESRAGLQSVRPPQTAIPYSGRCSVSVKVYRRRLTDPLGDCHKYHIDALRYCGMLVEDTDAAIRLTDEGHEKVESNEDERVEITIEYPGIDLTDLCNHYAHGPLPVTG